jgi:hypothetical protein
LPLAVAFSPPSPGFLLPHTTLSFAPHLSLANGAIFPRCHGSIFDRRARGDIADHNCSKVIQADKMS